MLHPTATIPPGYLPDLLPSPILASRLLCHPQFTANYYSIHDRARRSLTHASRRRKPLMAPQREAREGVEKRGRLPTRRASRITHHASHRRRVPGRSLLCAEGRGKRGTACHLCRPLPRLCLLPSANPSKMERRRWEAKTHHIDSVRLSIAVYSSCSEALPDRCRDAFATKRRPPPTTRRRPSA